ncbi:MAG: universal stress protein [Myxococcales bacterium]|nr:universal stress protein [Myxococcales bacterium]
MGFTILCPTDFSEASDRALRYAVELARPHAGAKIRLLHVDDLPTYGLPDGSVLDEPLRDSWRERLEDLVERFADRVEIVPVMTHGPPSGEILAHAGDVDLVVMATRGRNAFARALLGTTAQKVTRACPVPVLTIDPEAEVRQIRKVLCMVDLTPWSEPALDEAVRWAERTGATLYVVHAFELPLYTLPDGGSIFEPDLVARVRAQANDRMDAFLARWSTKAPVERLVVEGAPATVARQVMEDEGIDLVVLGTHGRSGMQRLLLGSVAERMLRTSHVPVMVVRAGGGT